MIASPYREITRPVLEYVKRISKDSPRTVVTVFIPEYVVGHWWEQVLHNQSALRLKGRLLFEPNVMVTSVPWQLNSSERLKKLQPQSAPGDARGDSWIEEQRAQPSAGRTHPDHRSRPPTGAAVWRATTAGWCSCATRCPARAGPASGGRRSRILLARRSYRGARGLAGPGRLAVPDRRGGRGRVLRPGVRRSRGGCAASRARWWPTSWRASAGTLARRVGRDRRTGRDRWRDGLADPGAARHLAPTAAPDFTATTARIGHRAATVRNCRWACSTDLADTAWPRGRANPCRASTTTARATWWSGARTAGGRTRVVEGGYEAMQRVGERVWRVPVTAFWQAHRDAAGVYSGLVAEWAAARRGMTAWDLYGGAGVFAAALARSRRGERAGDHRRHLARGLAGGAGRARRPGLCLGGHRVGAPRACAAQPRRADVAVLDPPRAGAGREVIDHAGRGRGASDRSHRL